MKLSIQHDTTYRYDDQVRTSIQYLRMTPQASARQQVIDWELELPRPVRAQIDPFGNILHVLTIDEPHEMLVIGARGEVEIDERSECERDDHSPLPYLRFTRLTQADDALQAFARQRCGERRDRNGLIELMHGLHEQMSFMPGATEIESTAAEAFAGRVGVCQDHTHAFLACARSLGIPARFISGYLYSEADRQLVSHAWAEAWVADAWYSFDVTNQLARPQRHLKLAVGLDYLDACPIRGTRRGGGGEQMHARVKVASLPLLQQQ
ncbi:transglutaminase family protein [Pseudomonas sp. LRF_L74]|uniref:transglutaminase family protein n=1 Tax=Pseudomonas sp. LRF_L74 TaxID=3369422 RepID=UPI003F6071DD